MGESFQMYLVVILGNGAEGVQCLKGRHRDLGNCGESLQGEVPTAPKQPPVGVVGPAQDREQLVKNVCSSVPVHTQEHDLVQPQDFGCIGREAAQ